MRNLKHNRKAISPVVACLFLIIITVTAGVSFYIYSLNKMGSLSTQNVEGLGTMKIIVDAYNWQNTNSLVLYVRNIGSSSFNVTGVSFETKSLTFTASCPNGNLMLPGQSCEIQAQTPSLTSGIVYSITVESSSAAFEFRLTYGSFGIPVSD